MGKVKGKSATRAATDNIVSSSSAKSSAIVGLWNEELTALNAKKDKDIIAKQAAAEGGSTKEIRRRRLELTIRKASEAKRADFHSVLSDQRKQRADAKAKKPATSLFDELMDALPTIKKPSAAESADPLAPVLARIQPTHKSTKKSRTTLDLGAIAQFNAIVNTTAFKKKPLIALSKHFEAMEEASKVDG